MNRPAAVRCSPGPLNAGLRAVAAADAALKAADAATAPISPPMAWPEPPASLSAAAGEIWAALVQARPAEDWNASDLYMLGRMVKSYEAADQCRALSSALDGSDEFAKLATRHVSEALAYARTLKLHATKREARSTPQDDFVSETHKLLNMELDLG